jgi:hypothetical protein
MAMEPAKYAKDTKTESLARIAPLTQRVNLVFLRTPSFRALSRLSRAIESRFHADLLRRRGTGRTTSKTWSAPTSSSAN